ncbi:MAG: DUF5663 domain-containing protein [Minisyncoccia bacterium]
MALKDLLGEEMAESILAKLGIEREDTDTQNATLHLMSEAILTRVVVEIFKKIPESERADFEAIAKSGDPQKILDFFLKFIPNLDAFVEEAARKEFEVIKGRAAELKGE